MKPRGGRLSIDSKDVLDRLDICIVKDQVVRNTFDVDYTLLTISIICGTVLVPQPIEKDPEAGAIREEVAAGDDS